MSGKRFRPKLAERFYCLLLLLYPFRFRRRHSADLLQAWRDLRRDPLGGGHRGRETGLWIFLVRDLIETAARAWASELGERKAFRLHRTGRKTPALGPQTSGKAPNRGGFGLNQLGQDIRFALRQLVKRPAFTAIVVFTLALGIGANASIFTVVNSILIQPLPYPDQDALLQPGFTAPGMGFEDVLHSEGTYFITTEENRAFEAMGVYHETAVNLTGDGPPERVRAIVMTNEVLSLLGAIPALGRLTTAADDIPGAPEVVVVSHDLWQRRLGADPAVVGRSIRVDGAPHEVVGVLGRDFLFPGGADEVFLPARFNRSNPNLGSYHLVGLARLGEGRTAEEAVADIERLISLLPERTGGRISAALIEQTGFAPRVIRLKDVVTGDVSRSLWIILTAVGLVLVIACANVANLLLVRAEGRQREVAVRTAMGASRADLTRHFLVESLLLGVLGGALGLFFAWAGTRALVSMGPDTLPRLSEIRVDRLVILFTLAVSLLSGVVFGLFPLLRYRTSEVASRLKEGGRTGSVGKERHRARSVLVVSQMALALVLLVGSGLMFRSFQALRTVDPGFDPANVLTLRLALPESEYPDSDSRLAFHDGLLDRLTSLPGVVSAGAGQGIPMGGGSNRNGTWIEEFPVRADLIPDLFLTSEVTAGYMETLGFRILEGRFIDAFDTRNRTGAVVVTRAMAERYWPGQSILGKRLTQRTNPIRAENGAEFEWQTIVGVIEDVHISGMAEEPLPVIYMPLVQNGPEEEDPAPLNLSFLVKTTGDPLALLPAVRRAVWAEDPNLPVADARTMDALVKDSMSRTSFTMALLGIAALVALLLGSIGIYGVISYVVTQRTREMGIRIALGAEERAVAGMVVRQGAALAGSGIAIGLAGAFGLTRLMEALLYGVTATDPLTFAGVAVSLAAVALLASYLPARRAARTDPVQALRNE